MKLDATAEDNGKVEEKLNEYDYQGHLVRGVEGIVIGAVGDKNRELVMASQETLFVKLLGSYPRDKMQRSEVRRQ